MNLSKFRKPSRYINHEVNSIHKRAVVSTALAFPDIYDIGMSHLGLKILYSIINSLPYAAAERVFSPWIDLEEEMKNRGKLLGSLESGKPLKDFDVVGFSLQYELSYTTVLNMLKLGGIPLRTRERLDRKEGPLVIAGGPCTLNPAPLAPFIDAFFVGDGEDAVAEILDTVRQWKEAGGGDKEPLLKALTSIGGVYVPELGKAEVARRVIRSLDEAPFPDSPVLPFAGIVHDRINIEISRGCSLGCRFCQAGMAYRPVRERSPEKVLELAERSLRNTGYEDVSFTSLSSGDYSCLPFLMREFNARFSERKIAMSLPSLRVGSVTAEMLKEIRTVRKTGFTMAPEAGTDRLRAVINKDFTHDMYVRALEILFREGWHNLKMYFMTGLPTETEEDVRAIPEMVNEAIKISKRLTGRNVKISIGVSSFVPKPHTPFQWCGQNALEMLKEKNSFLKRSFLKKGVGYKGHDEEMSVLEAVFARGDESLAVLLEHALACGCRLDAWTEVFDYGKWMRAAESSGIDAVSFATREYAEDAVLPWGNVMTGVTPEYLRREYRNAVTGAITSDCRKTCHACGLKCENAAETATQETEPVQFRAAVVPRAEAPLRIRMQYAKTGAMRFLSHLELVRAMLRAMRRSDFPLRYSTGFHPAPKVSFGPALGVGIAGLKEYLDFELVNLPAKIGALKDRLNATLPEGLSVGRMEGRYAKEKSLDSFVMRYTYTIRAEDGLSADRFLSSEEVVAEREKGNVDLKKFVEMVERLDAQTFRLVVCDQGETRVRLDELLPAMFGAQPEDLEITRTEMHGRRGAAWVEPMEDEEAWAVRS